MSRSIHQTVKSVSDGKSKREINDMIETGDEDFFALVRKIGIKREVRTARSAAKEASDEV